ALAYPPGGTITLRVTGAGGERSFPIQIDPPRVALTFGNSELEGGRLKVSLCIESSAASGTVDLKLQQGVLGSGADMASLTLEAGTCAEPPLIDSPRHSMRRVDIFATGEQVTASVALAGVGGVTATQSKPVTPPEPVALALTSFPTTFSAPRDVVEITAVATLMGQPVEGVPVRFETVPPTDLAPVTTLTNAAGEAKTNVQVPRGAVAVRVDAIAGPTRAGVTVRQAP
ncbi:MAG TPA: hypothetical protein VEU33_19155, partial [Archangium sp.]|nr:hypothetical protein [Archangium sp.]